MKKDEETKLSEIACKLSSMTFVLNGFCMYNEGLEFDSAKLVDFSKVLHEISNELFDLL